MHKMENTKTTAEEQIFIVAYEKYRPIVLGFFHKRLIEDFEAEDLTQDVFVKLLTLSSFLREESIGHLIFAIARNLSIDYNRRFFKRLEVTQAVIDKMEMMSNHTEETVLYRELVCLENEAIDNLSKQRGIVYRLSMDSNYSYKEMATILDISPRTVEHHLVNGRADVRRYIAACY